MRGSAGSARADGADPVGRLLALLDALPANVALWDRDVRLRYGNHRQLSRFGGPAAELVGAHLADLVQPHAVELAAQYIDGALAGVDGVVQGYCALAVDITASIGGYEQARRAREEAALQAERDRIAGDIGDHRVVDDLSSALRRLDEAVERAWDQLPSLSTAADAIEHTIEELRATVPNRMSGAAADADHLADFPRLSGPFDVGSVPVPPGVPVPPELTGHGWTADQAGALLDLLPAAIASWDESFANEFANRAALRWFGHADRDAVDGAHMRDLLGPGVFEADRPHVEAALAGEPQQLDRTVAHPSGLRHLQASYLPRRRADGRVDGVYSFVVDVTSRVEAELALQDARAELASAQERERIADELHNLVIQRLFAASLAATLPSAVTEAQLRSVQDGIVSALAELESALSTLHENVGVLDLLPALARLVHETVGPHGIEVTIENVGSVDYVPPGVGSELLAVTQAALSNVVRHSGAKSVVVTIAADAAGVWLRVVDDGRGLGSRPPGDGMADMEHRAERLSGTCTWRANSPTGTLVDWRVPIRLTAASQ
jgi:PAS domain S-box-containing protein